MHIILPLPLNIGSRNCIHKHFTHTVSSIYTKKQKDLQHEPDDSNDIMCASIIDYYLHRPEAIDHICLAEFASSYTKKGTKRRNNAKPYVIRYVKYNKHKDFDSYHR